MIKIPNYELLCSLQTDRAIELIKDTNTVFYRSGVWNEYYEVSTEKAINSIKNSGYGVDVYYNKENNMYYVSKPADSDMW